MSPPYSQGPHSAGQSTGRPTFSRSTGLVNADTKKSSAFPAVISGPKIPESDLQADSFPQKVFDSSADGFFEWRPQANKFTFSPSLGAMLGYVPGRLPLNLSSLAAHVFPADYPALKLSLAKALISGKDLTLKARMVTQQAKVSWFQLQLRVLSHCSDGQIESAIGSVSNIDHVVSDLEQIQKQANNEQWLRKTIRQLLQNADEKAITECLNQFCQYVDVDHVVLRKALDDGERYRLIAAGHHSRCPSDFKLANTILRKHMPYGFISAEKGNPISIDDSSSLPPDTLLFNQRFKELGIKSLATLPIYYHGNIDYYINLMMTTTSHHWDDDTIKLAESLGDALALVAARRQISQTLERNEEHFQNALDATQDGIWDWNIKTDNFYVTPSFLYMLGYDEEFLPLDRGKIAKLLVEPTTLNEFFLEQDNSRGRIEWMRKFRHADGREISVWVRGNQVAWDEHGKVIRCVGVNTNISRFVNQENARVQVVLQDTNSAQSSATDRKENNPGSQTQIATKQNFNRPLSLDEVFRQSKILLAEDNPINQQVATGILKRKGISVTVVNNGQEAVDMLNSSPLNSFDLVLMDMEMPVLDGYQATQVLRASENFKHFPIIALTAHAREEDRTNCLNKGMNDHVAKPVKPDLLYAAIARQLDHGAAAARL